MTKIWKVVTKLEGSLSSDHWLVAAKSAEQAIAKARKNTNDEWTITGVELIPGDFLR